MFPNNTLNSISPDGYMTQAFPNIFFLKEMAATSSIGALIGLDLAIHHPAQVRTLVAHEPPVAHLRRQPNTPPTCSNCTTRRVRRQR
jgi:hypothetical protein